MQSSITPATLAQSVIAVPPLARNADLSINYEENKRIINYLEAGGITTLLYGGNANFYHIRLDEYESLLSFLAESVSAGTIVIPSIGPSFGMMSAQIKILKQFDFPSAMILPTRDAMNSDGIEAGIRSAVNAYGKPIVLYIKNEQGLSADACINLVDDGMVSAIKYAIVRQNPANDLYLRYLITGVDPEIIVSGMGEQPAITHMRDWGLISFTSGCVCVAPSLSQMMLRAVQKGNYEKAESIRQSFAPLEDLRNQIHPVRVLHESLRLGNIADTGRLLPLLSNLEEGHHKPVYEATLALMTLENGV